MSFLGYRRRVHKEFYTISCLSSISLWCADMHNNLSIIILITVL